MTLKEKVEALISSLPAKEEEHEFSDALLEAERMADQFSSVKPVPYNVPMERFAGLPYYVKN